MTPRSQRLVAAGALLVVVALATAAPAGACATCYGAGDSEMTRGMNGAIFTLLGIIGTVQVGFVALFARFIVRSRRVKGREKRFRLIRGGTS